MTYQAFETTDGRPVEFITWQNGLNVWRRTNANIEISPGAFPFEPMPYKRSTPTMSKNSDDSRITFKVPGDFPVVLLYTNILTSNITTVTVERWHDNDPDSQLVVFWKGNIASVLRKDAEAEILCRPLTQGGHEIPRFTYQSSCNYFLFDGSSCRIARDDFKYETTLTGTNAAGTELEFSGLRVQAGVLDTIQGNNLVSGELDNYWINGYIETIDGELRRIAEANIGADPDVVRVDFPFLSFEVGDIVTVYAGCLRTMDICNRKFNNSLNFGGFNNVPIINPMATELPAGNSASTEKKGFW